jgi:hypothetical protein
VWLDLCDDERFKSVRKIKERNLREGPFQINNRRVSNRFRIYGNKIFYFRINYWNLTDCIFENDGKPIHIIVVLDTMVSQYI